MGFFGFVFFFYIYGGHINDMISENTKVFLLNPFHTFAMLWLCAIIKTNSKYPSMPDFFFSFFWYMTQTDVAFLNRVLLLNLG